MSKLETQEEYKVVVAKESVKDWYNLDHSIQLLFKKKLKKLIYNPICPKNRLHGDLTNCYKIKLRRIGYRLVYEVRQDTVFLIIWAVGKRDKEKAYNDASQRLKAISIEECTLISL